MLVALLLVLSCAKHSLAYSRPSASCDILLSTPVVNDSQVSEYSVYATAYHLEVNGSGVLLIGAANTPDERISGKGRCAVLTSTAAAPLQNPMLQAPSMVGLPLGVYSSVVTPTAVCPSFYADLHLQATMM